MRAWFVVLAVLASCGDNTHQIVSVQLGMTAEFAAYQDGGEGWRAIDVSPDGWYRFEVRDDYMFVAASLGNNPGDVWAHELAATYADGAEWFLDSSTDLGAQPAGKLGTASIEYSALDACLFSSSGGDVPVSGHMDEDGRVAMGRSCADNTAHAWDFTLGVAQGRHDLAALERSRPYIYLQRGIDVEQATMLPAIDPLTQGLPLATAQLTVGGAESGDYVSTDVMLYTATDSLPISSGERVPLSTTTATALIVPPQLLEPTDIVAVALTAAPYAGPDERTARTLLNGTHATFDLLAAPEVTPDSTAAVDRLQWSSLPPRVQYVDLATMSQPFPPSVVQQMTLTRGWIEAHGATAIQFDASAPGYLPEWTIPSTSPHAWSVSVRDQSGDVAYRSSIFGGAQPALMRTRPQSPRR